MHWTQLTASSHDGSIKTLSGFWPDLEFSVRFNCEKLEVELSSDEVMGLSSSQYFIAILMRAAFEC